MTRWVLLVATFAVGWPTVSMAVRQDAVESDGIGLTREAWEETHGPGNPGQLVVSYENDAFFVGFREELVTFIEFGYAGDGASGRSPRHR